MMLLAVVTLFIGCGATNPNSAAAKGSGVAAATSVTQTPVTTTPTAPAPPPTPPPPPPPPPPVSPASSTAVPPQYFGLHVHDAANWPSVPFGSIRLWDAGVSWPQLEPTKGQWNFATLDKFVSVSQQGNVDVHMVLGLSPQWASARPTESSAYNPGNAAEPKDIQDWRDFVQTVATRYKGRIHSYEIWNEPNDPQFFSGTQEKMLELATEAYKILKQVDPAITVVSPACTEDGGLAWCTRYMAIGGGNYADVIGYHFYVSPNPPESIAGLAAKVHAVMAQAGQSSKPLWDTETGWHPPAKFDSALEASYVARAYLMAWSSGASRFYWYAWDDHDWVSLQLTNADGTLRPAAQAFSQIRSWVLNSDVKPCSSDATGVWTCELSQSGHTSHVVWSVNGVLTLSVPQSWGAQSSIDLSGTQKQIAADGTLQISGSPMLLR